MNQQVFLGLFSLQVCLVHVLLLQKLDDRVLLFLVFLDRELALRPHNPRRHSRRSLRHHNRHNSRSRLLPLRQFPALQLQRFFVVFVFCSLIVLLRLESLRPHLLRFLQQMLEQLFCCLLFRLLVVHSYQRVLAQPLGSLLFVIPYSLQPQQVFLAQPFPQLLFPHQVQPVLLPHQLLVFLSLVVQEVLLLRLGHGNFRQYHNIRQFHQNIFLVDHRMCHLDNDNILRYHNSLHTHQQEVVLLFVLRFRHFQFFQCLALELLALLKHNLAQVQVVQLFLVQLLCLFQVDSLVQKESQFLRLLNRPSCQQVRILLFQQFQSRHLYRKFLFQIIRYQNS